MAVKTITGALTLVALLSLVALPGADSPGPSKTAISKSFAEWCPHLSASHVSPSYPPIADLFDRAPMMLR
jgi:hypothetical protein